MITYNEWKKTGIDELSSGDFGMVVFKDEGVLANQLEQLVGRLEGLLHGVSEDTKAQLIDGFMRQVEKRVLGL